MPRVALVSCSAVKLAHAAPAQELYQGQLFKLARRYIEGLRFFRGVPYVFRDWGILSAKHGLVLPEQVVEPYDLALGDLSRDEQRAWAARTGAQIEERWGTGVVYRVLAGRAYLGATAALPMVEDHFGEIAARRREEGKRTRYGIGLMKRDLKRRVERIERMHAEREAHDARAE